MQIQPVNFGQAQSPAQTSAQSASDLYYNGRSVCHNPLAYGRYMATAGASMANAMQSLAGDVADIKQGQTQLAADVAKIKDKVTPDTHSGPIQPVGYAPVPGK